MSSEPEENVDPVSEPNPEPPEKGGDLPSAPKENNNEQAKPKKRRRGKKRKHRKESSATCESENLGESEHENIDSPPWDSDEDLSCDVHSFTDVIIRPINVPKAPENSTQFIMDDHQECRLYMSFETPNPYLPNPPRIVLGDIVEPGEDAAYRDIDYEYESPQDFDNSAYYDREFEQSYKNNRFDELMRLPRAELIGMLHSLESRAKELHDDLVKENPSPMLDKLQHELLELQEKHNVLQEHNAKLTALVVQRHEEGSCAIEGGESGGVNSAEPRSSLSSGSYSPVHDSCYPLLKFVDNDMSLGLVPSDPRSYWSESRLFEERSDSPDFGSRRDGAGPSRERSESLNSGESGPFGVMSRSSDSGFKPDETPSEPREAAELSSGRSESPDFESRECEDGLLRESQFPDPEPCDDEVGRSESSDSGPLGKKSESTGSGPLDGDLNSHSVSCNNDSLGPKTRQRNNVDGVNLNVAFQEKCSSVVVRDEEQLSASETSVV